MENDDTDAIRAELGRINIALDQVTTSRSDLGVNMNRLNISQKILEKTKEDTDKKVKETEDVDIVKTISEFSQYQKALQASLAASTKVMNQTIMNYL